MTEKSELITLHKQLIITSGLCSCVAVSIKGINVAIFKWQILSDLRHKNYKTEKR